LVPHPPPGIEGILLPHYPSASIWVSLKEIIFVEIIKQNLAFGFNFLGLHHDKYETYKKKKIHSSGVEFCYCNKLDNFLIKNSACQ